MAVIQVTAAQALALLESGLVEWPPAIIAGSLYFYSRQMNETTGLWKVYQVV